jgi:hypothetical protein
MFKKIVTLTMLLATTYTVAFSQYALDKGKAQINAGLGFSNWGLPVYLGFDYGVHKDISLGAEASFRTYNENYRGFKYRHNIIGLAANGNYHFNGLLDIPKEWDFYAGLNVGFFIWNTNNDQYAGSGTSGLGLGAQLGGRYYFNEKFGLNLEVGGGNRVSGGRFGITIKL